MPSTDWAEQEVEMIHDREREMRQHREKSKLPGGKAVKSSEEAQKEEEANSRQARLLTAEGTTKPKG